MPNSKPNPGLLQLMNAVSKAGILPMCKFFAVCPLICSCKMSENAFRLQVWQCTDTHNLLQGICISFRVLIKEADAAHAGVQLNVRFHGYAGIFRRRVQFLRIFFRKHSLCDVEPRKLFCLCRRRIA